MFFKDAAQLEDERTDTGIQKIQASYDSNYDSWFDGKPESIDRRLAQCDRLLQKYSTAIAATTNRPNADPKRLAGIMAQANELRVDKRCLESLRHDILTAGMYREADDGGSGIGTDDSVPYSTHPITGMPTQSVPSLSIHREGIHNSKFVQVGAREFLADNDDCDDRKELLIRAENHAKLQTSTLPVNASRVLVAAFVDRVKSLSKTSPKKTARKKADFVEDFQDCMLFFE